MDLPFQVPAHFLLIRRQVAPYAGRDEIVKAVICAGKALQLLQQCQLFPQRLQLVGRQEAALQYILI